MLLGGCDDLGATQTMEISTSGNSQTSGNEKISQNTSSEIIVENNQPGVEQAEATGQDGFLVVVYSGEQNEAPKTQATVVVFKNDLVFNTGSTEGGAYRAVLPEGSYDVVILTASNPPTGLVRKDVTISKDANTVVTARTPSEGDLTVQLSSPSGFPALQDFTLIIEADGQEINRTLVRVANGGITEVALRTDMVYDLLIQYGDVEIRENGIQVNTQGIEIDLALPYEEGKLDLEVRADSQPMEKEAEVTLFDPSGNVLQTGTTRQGFYSTILPADLEYVVRIQYQGQVQERVFQVNAGGSNIQVFEFSDSQP